MRQALRLAVLHLMQSLPQPEETDSERFSNLPKVTQLLGGSSWYP